METKLAEVQWTYRQLQKANKKDIDACRNFLNAALWDDTNNDIVISERLDSEKNVTIYTVRGPIPWVEEFKDLFMKIATL